MSEKKIKIHMPIDGCKGDEVVKIVNPGVESSDLCEFEILPHGIREIDGVPHLAHPTLPGKPQDVDVILLHGIMSQERARLWRSQYPDIPCFVLDYKDGNKLHMTVPDVRCYFKRSMAYRHLDNNLGICDYSPHVVHHSSYCVREDILQAVNEESKQVDTRDIVVSCFFDPYGEERYARAPTSHYDLNKFHSYRTSIETAIGHSDTRRLCPTILKLAKEWYGCGYKMHIGKTHTSCVEGRRSPQQEYVNKLARSQIIVSAQPDGWEGDYRLMEALSSGALVLHNKMQLPPRGLIDGEHWVLYDNHMDMLDKVYHYAHHPEKAARIGKAGREYVLNNHRPKHRVESWLRTTGIYKYNK